MRIFFINCYRILLFFLLSCLTSCSSDRIDPPTHLENGSWSKIIDGLQARFSIERNQKFNETPIISVWIEFRNTSDEASPITINWNGGLHAKYSLTDLYNRDFVLEGVAYDGFDAPLEKIAIPRNSSLRYYVSKSGAGFDKNAKAMIDLGPTATYEIKSSDTNVYFLHCTILVEEQKEIEGRDEWHGVLKIPSIMVVK